MSLLLCACADGLDADVTLPDADDSGTTAEDCRETDFHDALEREVVNGAIGLDVGDIDGDDNVDIVLIQAGIGVMAMEGEGDGTFSPEDQVAGLENFGSDLALADWNVDEHLDLLIGDDGLVVELGEGDGTFDALDYLAMEEYQDGLTAFDPDGDGVPDVIAVSGVDETDSRLVVLPNEGEQIGEPVTLLDLAWELAVTDIDGDGLADAVTTQDADIVVLLSDGSVPAEHARVTSSEDGRHVVGAGDVDGDGIGDVFAASESGTAEVWLGDATTNFTAAVTMEVQGAPSGQVRVMNLDDDCGSEVYVTDQYEGWVLVYRWAGGTLEKFEALENIAGARWLAVGDADEDGAGDVMAVGTLSGAHVFLQD